MNWIEGITLFGVLITLCVAVGNWITTNRNLKTSKYIDTITSERIKWLSTVRNEVAELITNVEFALRKMQWNIAGKDPDYLQWEIDRLDSIDRQIEEMQSADIQVGVDMNIKKWSEIDYITRLRLLQLRFNPNEDRKIIQSIEFFIDFFSHTEIHQNSLETARKHVNIIIDETQTMLKSEWEKVKKESLGKRNK
ncbi:MAG TPA: hypothetical protein DEQ30_12800 [Porphyromonadaceae bacterium]|nr:hypothetical protein [Porphyromonadaceae bacterium]